VAIVDDTLHHRYDRGKNPIDENAVVNALMLRDLEILTLNSKCCVQ